MTEHERKIAFASRREDWGTPLSLFDPLDAEFHFDLDVCASLANAKCRVFYSQHGLENSWHEDGKAIWCNPPYGRQISKWVQKAAEEANLGCTVVMLLPARTDTQWFHDFVYGKAEVRFIRGRVRFSGAIHNAPFPSMIVIFRNGGRT